MTSDVSIGETASAASFFHSDGLIVTGSATGSAANPEELSEVKKAVKISNLPVLIGSGISPDNFDEFSNADGFIIGSYLKKNGFWSEDLDVKRVNHVLKSSEK